MKILVDTNILLRASQPMSIEFESSVRAVTHLPAVGFTPCLVPQVIYEYWVVATRPAEQNGLGFEVGQASQEIARLNSLFSILRDEGEFSSVGNSLCPFTRFVEKVPTMLA